MRFTPPRRARRRMAGLVMPCMLSRRTGLRLRGGTVPVPPLGSLLPPCLPPDMVYALHFLPVRHAAAGRVGSSTRAPTQIYSRFPLGTSVEITRGNYRSTEEVQFILEITRGEGTPNFLVEMIGYGLFAGEMRISYPTEANVPQKRKSLAQILAQDLG